VKDYLTMKEAGLLLGKTTKTIKNYIKRGIIKNYFLVDGKYGQEYKISIRDLEPLGITCLDVMREDFSADGKRGHDPGNLQGTGRGKQGNDGQLSGGELEKGLDAAAFVSRYEEMVIELESSRVRSASLAEENIKLKQELEEKNMLIQVLIRKKEQA
jgi:hypothetical protein